jgi:hypothetical protein
MVMTNYQIFCSPLRHSAIRTMRKPYIDECGLAISDVRIVLGMQECGIGSGGAFPILAGQSDGSWQLKPTRAGRRWHGRGACIALVTPGVAASMDWGDEIWPTGNAVSFRHPVGADHRPYHFDVDAPRKCAGRLQNN